MRIGAWELPLGGFWASPDASNKRACDPSGNGPDRVQQRTPGPMTVGALGLAAGLTLAPLVYHNRKKLLGAFQGSSHPWIPVSALPFASISAATIAPSVPDADSAPADVSTVEPRTGLAFPKTLAAGKKKTKPCCKAKEGEGELGGRQALVGVGVRVRKIMGLARIKVYAFGVYIDKEGLKQRLGEKYRGVPLASLKASKELLGDIMASDCPVTVRLVINYKGLKIGQVRNAFNDSLGSSLKALSGKPEPDLLHDFTKWFSEGVELKQGTVIDLRRSKGHVVTTEFDGMPAGSVTSPLLSRALLSLYLGESPFDSGARDAVKDTVAGLVAG